MSSQYSCCVTIAAGQLRDDLEIMWCGRGKSDAPGANFVVPLSATGAEPATHYGCNDQCEADEAAIYAALPTDGGTIPSDMADADWGALGITEARAKAACAAAKVSVMTGIPGGTNFAALIAQPGIDLQRIVPTGGPPGFS